MHVHLFNWPVSPSYIGWADPVEITASGGAHKGGGSKRAALYFYYVLKTKFVDG
jgi:hypothetical protein